MSVIIFGSRVWRGQNTKAQEHTIAVTTPMDALGKVIQKPAANAGNHRPAESSAMTLQTTNLHDEQACAFGPRMPVDLVIVIEEGPNDSAHRRRADDL
jgi:hypothetical protein